LNSPRWRRIVVWQPAKSFSKFLMGRGRRIRPCIVEKSRGRGRKHSSDIAVCANAIQRALVHARKEKESSVSYGKTACHVSRSIVLQRAFFLLCEGCIVASLKRRDFVWLRRQRSYLSFPG
jgi:hypothetical protein